MSSILAAWSVARLLSGIYMWICSAAALLTIASWVGLGERPTGVIVRAFEVVRVTPPTQLRYSTEWLSLRGPVIGNLMLGLAIVALAWSFLHLLRDPYDFHRVKGPATAWFAVAIAYEAFLAPSSRSIVLIFVVGAALAIVGDALQRPGQMTPGRDWAASKALFGLGGGLLLTVLWAPMGLLEAIGGATKAKVSATQPAS